MLKVEAIKFFELGESSSAARWRVFWAAELGSLGGSGKGRVLFDSEKGLVKDAVIALSGSMQRIGLSTSLELLKERENDLPQTSREWEVLVAAVRAELENNLFLFVPSHRANFCELILPGTVTGHSHRLQRNWWQRGTA